MSIVDRDKLRSILKYMLDENEFLSPYGIRALSRYHERNPYVLHVGDAEHRVDYEPGESQYRTVWRQLQLAWADLVPDELPAGRVAAALPLLPRRRLQSRVSHGLGRVSDIVGCSRQSCRAA